MKTSIEIKLKPFHFPNFLHVTTPGVGSGDPPMVDCGLLTLEQAGEYWDQHREAWVAHCLKRGRNVDR